MLQGRWIVRVSGLISWSEHRNRIGDRCFHDRMTMNKPRSKTFRSYPIPAVNRKVVLDIPNLLKIPVSDEEGFNTIGYSVFKFRYSLRRHKE